MRFSEKSVLITGAASGIGRATAARFVDEGAKVIGADLDAGRLEDACAEIGATAVACDVSDPAACNALIDAAVGHNGTLDVLCNIAGLGVYGASEALPDDAWAKQLAVNLSGPFYLSRAALPHLLKTRGNVVNLASTAGVAGVGYAAGYAASKGGLVALTRSLAVEYGRRGVRFNCVCPGGVDTPLLDTVTFPEDADPKVLSRMQLVDRIAKPDEIAAMVAYVASDDAGYVNGAALVIDGGQTA